ncbi:putative DNA-binding transcriptional regulator YafY [Catenulispora sp. GAS73]|uniref:helix-turn-helix transcriptional regulator n=1 Tax=Catenulispora sp. GAS73 TaxID=3156269 RepID=UPI0035175E7D
MNRTDRLYALVEDLRAVAPGRRTAREMAERYEVSLRTIERDISALQQSGVPIYADVGRSGGYTIDKRMSLPPLNFSPTEAVAVAVALGRMHGTPFAAAGSTALGKILAAMSDDSAGAARAFGEKVRLLEAEEQPEPPPFAELVRTAIMQQRVLAISYTDHSGTLTNRAVEPMKLLWADEGWYLVGWCRLRQEARTFRLDRIKAAELTDFDIPPRPPKLANDLPPGIVARTLAL